MNDWLVVCLHAAVFVRCIQEKSIKQYKKKE